MISRVVRALGFLGSILLAMAGASALLNVVKSVVGGGSVEPISNGFLGMGLIVLGYGGIRYLRDKYRGGACSIIGAIFVLAGTYGIIGSIESFDPTRDKIIELVAGITMVWGGGLLLKAGHVRHRRIIDQIAERST